MESVEMFRWVRYGLRCRLWICARNELGFDVEKIFEQRRKAIGEWWFWPKVKLRIWRRWWLVKMGFCWTEFILRDGIVDGFATVRDVGTKRGYGVWADTDVFWAGFDILKKEVSLKYRLLVVLGDIEWNRNSKSVWRWVWRCSWVQIRIHGFD